MSALAHSLERVAKLHGDPVDLIYQRLFAERPELEALFVLDASGQVRGSMLANLFEALIDLTGPNRYGLGQFQAECLNHEGMGVPRREFVRFVEIVRDVSRDLLGSEWTPELEDAWAGALARIAEATGEA